MSHGLVIPNTQTVAPAPKSIFTYFKAQLEEIVNGGTSYSLDEITVYPLGFTWANEFRIFDNSKFKSKSTEPYAVLYMLAIVREDKSKKEHLISLKVDKNGATPLDIWAQIILSSGKENVLSPLKKAPAAFVYALLTKGVMLKHYGIEVSRKTLMVDEDEVSDPTFPIMSPLGIPQVFYKETMSIGKGGKIEQSSIAMRFPEGNPSKSALVKLLKSGPDEVVGFVRETVESIDISKYLDLSIRNELDIDSHLAKWAQTMVSQREYMENEKLTKPDTQFNLGGVVYFAPGKTGVVSLAPKEFYDLATVSVSSENVD